MLTRRHQPRRLPRRIRRRLPSSTVAVPQVRFAHFRFDARTRELFKRGRRVRLGEKPAQVLEALLARPGDLVTRDELRGLLWSADTYVDFDNNLNSAVAALRETLGDSARRPKYVETLSRRGYRFIAPLEAPSSGPEKPGVEPRHGEPSIVSGTAAARGMSAVRSPVAAAAVLLVAAVLTTGDRQTPRASPSADLLDARFLLARGSQDDVTHAIRLLDHADASDAATLETLAEAWLARARRGGGPAAHAFERAAHYANRALAAGGASGDAWRVLASVRLHLDRDAAAAAVLAARARAAAPRDPRVLLTFATVDAVRGRHDSAIEAAREAVRLEPGGWRVRADLAFFLLAAGRDADALAECRAVLALAPAHPFTLDMQLTAAARLGAWREARAAALALMTLADAPHADREGVATGDPSQGVDRYRRWQVRVADRDAERARWSPVTAAAIYASAGNLPRALYWLSRAEAARDPGLVLLPAMRDFDPIRHAPAFLAIQDRITRTL